MSIELDLCQATPFFAKPFGMARANIENKSNIWAQHGRKLFHVALVADASLHDQNLRRRRWRAWPGHADLVVVVQGISGGFAAHGEHLGQHFAGWFLPADVGDTPTPGAGFVAPQRGDAARAP